MTTVTKFGIYLGLLVLTLYSCHERTPEASSPTYWAINAGGNFTDNVQSSCIDKNGNLYASGYVSNNTYEPAPNSTVIFGNKTYALGNGLSNVFFAKINQYGKYEWVKILGGGGAGFTQSNDIKVDEQGNIYIYGYFSKKAFSSTDNDLNMLGYCLAKCDNQGNLIWLKEIGATSAIGLGDILIDEQSNVYITGSFDSEIQIDNHTLKATSQRGLYLAKFSSDGELQWYKQIEGYSNIYCSDITKDAIGNIYLGGHLKGNGKIGNYPITSSDGEENFFLAKFTKEGESIWAKAATSNELIRCSGLIADENSIYVSGTFYGIAKFEQVVLASQESSNRTASYDIYVAKYDLNGNLIWVKPFGSSGEDASFGIAKRNNNLYLTGYFGQAVIFGDTTLSPVNYYWDSFILKINMDGKVHTARQYDLKTGFLHNILVDDKEDIYVTGKIGNSTKFGNSMLSTYGLDDLFFAKTKLK